MTDCNSKTPVSLIILAAGMGRRFGGDKQLAWVGDTEKPLMYFSVMDAYRAGVRHLVLVINDQIMQAIKKQFLPLLPADLEVSLVLQCQGDLPAGNQPVSRNKPWGTGHALWSARHVVAAACIVINADDYYGPGTMMQMVSHFENHEDWAMVSFPLANTLSGNGAVNRGLCKESDGFLVAVEECLEIEQQDGVIHGMLDGTLVTLNAETPVSMNIWGFGRDIFRHLGSGLETFLSCTTDLDQAEFYLPVQVMTSISSGKNRVRVYQSRDRWHGLTHQRDMELLGGFFC